MGLGHARWSMGRLRAGADDGCERMEQDGTQNGTVAERAVGDEGVQVHQPAVYRCSVCTVWHTGMWACGHGMFVIVGILDTCVPQSVEWEMRCRCRQAKPRGGCNCKRAQPTVASRLCTYLPTWVGVLPGGGGR